MSEEMKRAPEALSACAAEAFRKLVYSVSIAA
jgi:hypothetical protein